MKCDKKLVYFKTIIKKECERFEEEYTCVQSTIFYLPEGFVLTISDIEPCKIRIHLKNLFIESVDVSKILSLCSDDSYELKVNYLNKEILICIKLCDIKILKPCK